MCLKVYNELSLDLCRLYDLKIEIGYFQVPNGSEHYKFQNDKCNSTPHDK